MSKYLKAITEALIDVMSRAASSADHRLVGYAANVDFWAAEIVHCTAAIYGFKTRQELFLDAAQRAAARIREAEIYDAQHRGLIANPTHLLYGESPSTIQRENHLEEVGQLRTRLEESARQFLGRIRNEELIALDRWQELTEQLPFLKRP